MYQRRPNASTSEIRSAVAIIFARCDFVNVLRASHRDHSYHFVVAVWRAKKGDAIGGGGDESDEALA